MRRARITALEQAYDSLTAFKTVVNHSHEDFISVNQSKDDILKKVEAIEKNCRMAQKYHTEMQSIVEGIGGKIANVSYGVLLNSISAKLRSYANQVNDHEDRIDWCNNRIQSIEMEIELIRMSDITAQAAQEAQGGI